MPDDDVNLISVRVRSFFILMKPIVQRAAMIVVGCFVYATGYYHRNCAGMLQEQMAKALGTNIADMGILSTTYFWAYAIVQPFVGMLSDVIDTKYIVSINLFLTALGSIGCALSRKLVLTAFCRAVVGLGCGCLYVPVCRAIAQWFTPKIFPIAQSILISFGGLGAFLAQFPLGYIKESENWYLAFVVGSAISLVLSVFALLFLRGSPNQEIERPSFKQASSTLWVNIRQCLTFRDFWLLAMWKFLTASTYSSVSSTWGASYLEKGLGYSHPSAGQIISITSVTWSVGSPFLSILSNAVHNRKICLLIMTVVAAVSSLSFIFINHTTGWILAVLIIFSLSTGASLTIAAIMFKEMLTKDIVGTLMGCGNLFLMVGTSIEQVITGEVLKHFQDGMGKPTLNGFKYGLWTLSAVSCTCSIFFVIFIKDTFKKAMEPEDPETNEKIEDQLITDEEMP